MSEEFTTEWPHDKPALGGVGWNTDLRGFMEILLGAEGLRYWIEDWDVKYLNLRIDTRDLGFILSADGRGPAENMKNSFRICPTKVVAAIEKHRERYGDATRRKKST